MLNQIPKDKVILDFYLKKIASSNHRPGNITDILVSLVKMAGEKSLDSLQAEVDYILKTPEAEEIKKSRVKKLVETNINTLIEHIFSLKGSDDSKSNAVSFILGTDDPKEKDLWINYNVNALLHGFKLPELLQRIVNQGTRIDTMQEDKRAKQTQSLEGGEEQFGNQFLAPTVDLDEEHVEVTPEQQIATLEKILQEKSSPYLPLFLGKYKQTLETMAEAIHKAGAPKQMAELQADFDKEMQSAALNTKLRYQDVKRFSKQSVADVDNEFNAIKADDELINNIFRATGDTGKNFLYDMPLMFRKYLMEHPDFARLLFKTGLNSMLYLRLKKILGVRIPKVDSKQNLSLGELWHTSLNKAIDETVSDPGLNAKFKRESENSLMAPGNSGEMEYKSGLRPVTDFFAPLVHAGHFVNIQDKYGDNFTNIPDEEKHQLISDIVNKSHNMYEGSSNTPLPHVTPKAGSPRLFDVHDFDKLNKNPQEVKDILHQELLNRFHNAQDIVAGEKMPGSLLDPRMDKIQTSMLQSLIKKYAFKS